MNYSGRQLLADVIAYSKYASYKNGENRRETRKEIIDRNKEMHIRRFPHLKDQIEEAYQPVYENKLYPSMRSLQFGGRGVEKHNAKLYNCSYAPVDHPKIFSELAYLLLCGCGVGYSVKQVHIQQLPSIKTLIDTGELKVYTIQDSIEGWADAIDTLLMCGFEGRNIPLFDYSKIRAKGTRLSTGVIAPGPDKLRTCLERITDIILKVSKESRKLTSLEVHDIICHIADCVVSGGVRRSAMICLFDWNDIDMLTCKVGNWWENNPQRGRANNSVAINRNWDIEVQKERFFFVIQYLEQALLSGSGDPGITFTWDDNYGFNPCAEAFLYYNFCCLVEIIGTDIKTQEELNDIAAKAAFIATLQASYTDFPYLRPIWEERTREEALIGVGITGIVEGKVLELNLAQAAEIVKQVNQDTAHLIGINPAHRTTVIKPSGTSTLFSGSLGSGCHDVPSKTSYIRRIRVGKTEPLYYWLINNMPNLVEDEAFDPENTAVLSVPIRVDNPENIRYADTAIEFLERVELLYNSWILPGHIQGPGTNNVSATCTVKPNEYTEVFDWLWEHRNSYNGISLLPEVELSNYPQMPIEPTDIETIERMEKELVVFNPVDVYEPEDFTSFINEAACAGGQCSIV